MNSNIYRRLSAVFILTALTSINAVAQTPSPPPASDKPLRILVGLPPGGAVDLIARLIGEKLKPSLNQPVVVENRPGAQTRIAIQALKSAAPDGNTVLVSPGAVVTLYPHMFKQLGYDPFKDITPVSMLAVSEYGFAVPADSPAKTFVEFVAMVKADPRLASYATPSTGSPQHFVGILLSNATDTNMQAIGYKGASEAITALMGGQVPSAMLSLGELVPAAQAGKIKVLATFGDQRAAVLPNVPSIKEAGFPQLQASGWFALFVPGGTPAPIVDRLNKAVVAAIADPEVRDRIAKIGLTARSTGVKEIDDLDHSEYLRWQGPVKTSGYVAD